MKQIMAAALAVIVLVFGVGSPLVSASAETLESNHFALTQAASNVAPQEASDDRIVSVVHAAFVQVSSGACKTVVPFARYINCDAFFVNSHVRNAIYALPCIHAP